MAKPSPEYRTDTISCSLNKGKLQDVVSLILLLRQTAEQEKHIQWQHFYKNRWQEFESTAKKDFTRPWLENKTLNTTFSQLVMAQVASSLKGHMEIVKNTYKDLVVNSKLNPQIKHQLHFINRKQAWFWNCDVKVKQMVEILDKNNNTKLIEQDVVILEDVKSLAKQIIRKALSLHIKPNFNNFQPQLDQRVCFVQQSHTAKQEHWLNVSLGKIKKNGNPASRLNLPLHFHQHFIARNNQAKIHQALFQVEQLGPPPQHNLFYHGQSHSPFLLHMQKLEKNKVPKNTNPYPTEFAIPNTVRLILSEDHKSLSLGVVSNMGPTFAHQKDVYTPKQENLYLDLGLCTLLATDCGELHGQNWMTQLEKYDKLLCSIAKHRQRLGLKTASPRYRKIVAKMRGFVKTDINRILNKLVKRKMPAHIVMEKLDFKNPGLSKRMNRLLQNFGKSVITQKLLELEKQFGITTTFLNPAYSSKQCSQCLYTDKKNRKTQSKFQCRFCGFTCHADVQASKVLKQRRSLFGNNAFECSSVNKVLVELVNQFNKQHTSLRGQASDPRLDNPYFSSWVKTQEQGLSAFGEVNLNKGNLA